MTLQGGSSGFGRLFSINTSGSGYTDIIDFNGSNGKFPYGYLTLSGSALYGMTFNGGANSDGILFSVNTNGTGFTDMLDFNSTNGKWPFGSLTFSGTAIYGMTYYGGTSNEGVIFSKKLCNIIVTATTTANVSCKGGSNGSASVTATSGFTPYTYLWSGGGTGSNVIGLTAGTYTVTVTDNHGCFGSATATVTQPATALTASISSFTDLTCYGVNTGSITASASGGASPYTYVWSDGASQTTATATGLSAGSYTVTVTDAYGCTINKIKRITQPALLNAVIISQSNLVCNGDNTGSAKAKATGGTSPYTYLWSNGQTTATASNLVAGTYTITITDLNGCTATTTAVITAPYQLTVTIQSVNAGCKSSNGSATASVSGGTPSYHYLWSTGQTTSAISSLSAGNYTVTVTDSKGCTSSSSVSIGNVGSPTVTILPSSELVIYNGGSVAINTVAAGGVTPYTYAWGPSAGLSCTTCPNPIASPTVSTMYWVTVTDANGCSTPWIWVPVQVITAPIVQTPTNCDTCIGGLNLLPGKTYIFSVWAKNNVSTPSDTDYLEPAVKVEFGSTVFGPFKPQGMIIDGWQRIEGQFTVPTNATLFNIVLSCNGGDCNFDDIRVSPFNGTLKTYVYDPITLRLMAVLDERNYATIYEYDEEGKLIRVKKETERGIMTIQESRTAMQKR